MTDQILNLSKKLISVPSTSDNKQMLNEVLNVALEELKNFKYKKFESNGVSSLVFYNTKTLPEKFKVILNGHLDVVSAKDEQYKPFEKNNRLYGRGSYDMKSATAALITLFRELAKKVDYPLGLQLVTDEEVGGFNGAKHQLSEGIQTEFILAGENTNLLINNKSKGILWLKVTTKGKTSHGAYPWLGENAIWKMHKVLTKIEKLYPVATEEVWQSTINLARIETSNKTVNKVPDECTAFLDVRFIPKDKDNLLTNLKEELANLAELELTMDEPAHYADESDIFLKKLKDSIKKVLGKEGETISKHGGSDVRFYSSLGIPAVTFGPTGAGHHSDEEWVDIESLNDYYQILKDFLLSV